MVIFPVNYIALDFGYVIPNLGPQAAALLRPAISLVIKVGCFEPWKLKMALPCIFMEVFVRDIGCYGVCVGFLLIFSVFLELFRVS